MHHETLEAVEALYDKCLETFGAVPVNLVDTPEAASAVIDYVWHPHHMRYMRIVRAAKPHELVRFVRLWEASPFWRNLNPARAGLQRPSRFRWYMAKPIKAAQ